MEFTEAEERLGCAGQGHVLAFWRRLDAAGRSALLADVARLDWTALEAARAQVLASDPGRGSAATELAPPASLRLSATHTDPSRRDCLACGRELIAAGRVAALTVAGGQGTRLGHPGPKGTLPITPVRGKSLFQHFAESMRAAQRRYARAIPWLIMTSPDNDPQTRSYFQSYGTFGLPPATVRFFIQGVMPAFSKAGAILLAEPHRIAFAPDGHGGTLTALRRSGMLDFLLDRGVQYLSYFQVDNPLVPPLDEGFIGLVSLLGSEIGSKATRKASDDEKVGVFAVAAGRLQVIEYIDLPPGLAAQHQPDGSRTYDMANIAAHLLAVVGVERLTRGGSCLLPWHRAEKIVPHVDLATGQPVEPSRPNAVKCEQFIFDAIPRLKNPLLLEVDRAEEFAPVKNAAGPDSPATARAALSARAARWLQIAGAAPPSRAPAGGGPDDAPPPVEISPLFALDPQELAEKLAAMGPLDCSRPLCLE